jgi:membrane protein DedA with SNARE-associated domain/membrane-associated phospholipid phosphatase
MGHLADRILALHGVVALLVVFLFPALEASAFVGVVVPGEIAVLLGGVLAFEHRVSLPAVVAAAVAGAIIGDTVGYWVGRRWGRTILDSSVGRLVKREHLDRAERYLAERGGPAVFVGRFTAALRALIPGLSGIAHMRYRTFAAYNAAGGAIWATGFVLLGYIAGTGYRRVEHIAGRAGLLLLVVVVGAGGIALAGRWVAHHPDRVRRLVERVLGEGAVARARERYQTQIAFLARRLRPEGALGLSLTVSILAIALAAWAFGSLLFDVLSHGELALVDQPVQNFFVAHREPWLTLLVRGASNLGNAALLIGGLVAVGLLWRWRGRTWRPLELLAIAFAGAWLLSNLVKVLVHRPRPPAAQAIGHWTGYAFPSGHVTHATAVYGMLAALLAAATSRWSWKVAAWTGVMLVVAAVAFSRLYLGAHWLTDVLGGMALGAAWLFGVLAGERAIGRLRTAGAPRPAEGEQAPESTARARDQEARQGEEAQRGQEAEEGQTADADAKDRPQRRVSPGS